MTTFKLVSEHPLAQVHRSRGRHDNLSWMLTAKFGDDQVVHLAPNLPHAQL